MRDWNVLRNIYTSIYDFIWWNGYICCIYTTYITYLPLSLYYIYTMYIYSLYITVCYICVRLEPMLHCTISVRCCSAASGVGIRCAIRSIIRDAIRCAIRICIVCTHRLSSRLFSAGDTKYPHENHAQKELDFFFRLRPNGSRRCIVSGIRHDSRHRR